VKDDENVSVKTETVVAKTVVASVVSNKKEDRNILADVDEIVEKVVESAPVGAALATLGAMFAQMV
jgi:hypothetical protein